MDIASVIGIVLAIGLVLSSIMMSDRITTFVNMPSVLLVAGGTIAVCLISFPLANVVKILGVVRKVFLSRISDPVEQVASLVRLAEVARRDGILSLENHLADGDYDDFMVRGLRMAIDGQDPAVIQSAMEQEVETLMERHAAGRSIFDTAGKYAPAFGMLGTLIGLIVMLRNMDDPSKLANVLFLPIADKLGNRSAAEVASKMLIIRGVMSIQSGDNPRIVQQKLMSFLNAHQRRSAGEGQD
jgi:chemotaxis protein MotA